MTKQFVLIRLSICFWDNMPNTEEIESVYGPFDSTLIAIYAESQLKETYPTSLFRIYKLESK